MLRTVRGLLLCAAASLICSCATVPAADPAKGVLVVKFEWAEGEAAPADRGYRVYYGPGDRNAPPRYSFAIDPGRPYAVVRGVAPGVHAVRAVKLGYQTVEASNGEALEVRCNILSKPGRATFLPMKLVAGRSPDGAAGRPWIRWEAASAEDFEGARAWLEGLDDFRGWTFLELE